MSAELEQLNNIANFFLGLADRAGPGLAKDFLLDITEFVLARAVPLDAETALGMEPRPESGIPEAE